MVECPICEFITMVRDEELPSKSYTPSSHSSQSYSSSRDDDDYDNMRGWDPASEDDMEDNGMRRYMENYDEEAPTQLVVPRAVSTAEMIEASICSVHFSVSFLLIAYLLSILHNIFQHRDTELQSLKTIEN